MMIIIVFLLFFISGIVNFFIWRVLHVSQKNVSWISKLDVAPVLSGAKVVKPKVELHISGKLPAKMYINDSFTVNFRVSAVHQAHAVIDLTHVAAIQMQLLAAGFEIRPDTVQIKPPPTPDNAVFFYWNIMASSSGVRNLALIASWIDKKRLPSEFDAKSYKIIIKDFAGLTVRQLRVFAVITGSITLVTGIAGVIISWLQL